MTYDGRADHLLAYFRSEVLAAYQAQSDKFSVSTDHFEGRVETTGAYFEVLDAADRTDESIGVLFGYRTQASGELAVVVWGPDLFDKSAWHVQQWSAFRIDGRAVDWMPVPDDTRFNLWTRRYLSGDWNVENGPGAALAEVVALINGLTLEIVGSRLFDVDEPRISFPAAENTHRYADAHRELYGVIADGLDKATIQAIASALGRAVACASDRTLSCLRKALPELDKELDFSTPLATMAAQRRLATHKVRPAAQPIRAFDAFTEDLRGCVGALEKLRTTLETAFGVDAAKCRSRQDALRHLGKFADENLPANYGIYAARGMIGKTVETVRVGEREHTAGVHRSEIIEIHFTDGSVMSLHTGSNANGIRPRAGETDVTPYDFHADFIVEWVPARPDRKPTDPAE